MDQNQFHLGTETVPRASFSDAPLGYFEPIEKQAKTHAYETFEGDSYYDGICRTCEAPESEHNGLYKIVAYLKALVDAYRNPQSEWAERKMVYWGERLATHELVMAYEILAVTGIEAWK